MIKNIAAANAIRKAVDITPGCACVSVQQQADFYIVHLSECGQSRVIRVDDAVHALRLLQQQKNEVKP